VNGLKIDFLISRIILKKRFKPFVSVQKYIFDESIEDYEKYIL